MEKGDDDEFTFKWVEFSENFCWKWILLIKLEGYGCIHTRSERLCLHSVEKTYCFNSLINHLMFDITVKINSMRNQNYFVMIVLK